MIKAITLFLGLIIGFQSFGQNLKTSVLVVGATPAGMAAAIQSAKSGVKTILIDAGNFESLTLSSSDRAVKAGIYADFIKHVDSLQKYPAKDNQSLSATFTASVFKGWADTIKNLTLVQKSSLRKIKKSGKGWQVDLVGREIKAEILVDGSLNNALVKMLSVPDKKALPIKSANINTLSSNGYRTSLAIVKNDNSFSAVPLSDFIIPEIENLILTNPGTGQSSLQTGQAAGTIAAYCAFFKTSTKNLDVRKIQSELLTFRAQLIHFHDLAATDSSMIALQHLGVTGILKGKAVGKEFLFSPNLTVSTDDIKQPIREYYSRSQIWFLDNKADKITLENALSLIKFAGSKGEELNKQVLKGWKSPLRLTGEFDLKKTLTRKELAILLDTYLQPFSVAIDLSGNVKK